jgi:opacity protein-like surface antigen
MKLSLKNLAVSVVALAAVTTPAAAGDWNNGDGSLKDQRGRSAVAVPAPMPIPEANGLGWYIRGDVGIGRAGSKDISEHGMSFGRAASTDAALNVTKMDVPGPLSPFGSSPSWFNNDGKTLLNFGAGIGYHWSKSFRTDVTLDRRDTDKYTGSGTYSYTTTTRDPLGAVLSTTSSTGRVSDDTTLKSGALLLNGYYDVGTKHGFTPYIGAGVGLALLTAKREVSASQTDTCVVVVGCGGGIASASSSGSASVNALSFAAMATVGVSYALTQNTAIDVNYRYMFINGTDVSTTVYGQNSKITLGDIGEHQLRAGLRWDIN